MREIPKPLQVYIVEDSTIIRRLLTSTIEAAGAELVGHSGDAQSAIADLSVLRPDLILIDISLNSGTGFDVLKALQERNPEVDFSETGDVMMGAASSVAPEIRMVAMSRRGSSERRKTAPSPSSDAWALARA